MEPTAGDEVLSHRHKATSKALEPLLAIVSYEADEDHRKKLATTFSKDSISYLDLAC